MLKNGQGRKKIDIEWKSDENSIKLWGKTSHYERKIDAETRSGEWRGGGAAVKQNHKRCLKMVRDEKVIDIELRLDENSRKVTGSNESLQNGKIDAETTFGGGGGGGRERGRKTGEEVLVKLVVRGENLKATDIKSNKIGVISRYAAATKLEGV